MRVFAISAVLATLTAGVVNADPIEGVWQTEVDDGAYAHVTISPCNPGFCGIISRTFNADGEYQSPNLGEMIVINMVPSGTNKYNGQVWRPSNDQIYIGKVTLKSSATKMDLRGCVAGGLICAKQKWTRLQ